MLDISDIVGAENTFLLNVQPHTWTGDKYKNPDGGTIRTAENQASQTLIIRGFAQIILSFFLQNNSPDFSGRLYDLW